MYSTKLNNKMQVDKNAYICIGDPYKTPNLNPFRAPKKIKDKDGNIKKLEPVKIPIPKQGEQGMFGKIEFKPTGYAEVNHYHVKDDSRYEKRGFGSKDPFRRDEFANGKRTEQYRESIRKEKYMLSKHANKIDEKVNELLAERERIMAESTRTLRTQSATAARAPQTQFDIGRSCVTDFNPKATRDSFYQFDDSKGKHLGDQYKPVSYNIGDLAWETNYQPPTHGGRSEVKNFLDRSHLGKHAF